MLSVPTTSGQSFFQQPLSVEDFKSLMNSDVILTQFKTKNSLQKSGRLKFGFSSIEFKINWRDFFIQYDLKVEIMPISSVAFHYCVISKSIKKSLVIKKMNVIFESRYNNIA